MEQPTRAPRDPEFRARAVELVRTRGLPRRWVKQAEVDTDQRAGLTSDEKAELARPRRENARVALLS